MELVRDDGSAIQLKEGQRHELGRGGGFAAERDESVSRLHVVVELLRPASRKGKEVVGESPALKLHLQVVGRNPICIVSRVAEDKNLPRIKFAGRGENDWLAPGDKFALSIRRPLFFVLRQCSCESLGTDVQGESHSVERNNNAAESGLNSPVEKDVMEVESSAMDEEEGIAKAVARRQRRRLEREEEERRVRSSQQQQSEDGGLGNPDLVKPNAESHEEASVVPCRPSDAMHPFDPVSEFGFIVEGSEFQMYEKRSKKDNGRPWNWKIDKKGETEEDGSEDEVVVNKNERNSWTPVEKALPSGREDDDQEWGGDTKEEERIAKERGPPGGNKVSTRSSKSNRSGQKRTSNQILSTQPPTHSGTESEDSEDSRSFIVDDSDTIEGDEDDEEEWMDDDETVSHKDDKRSTIKTNKKPVCKYGSNCYRKNKEHLSQFSHPQT